jgi:hypothetical protein
MMIQDIPGTPPPVGVTVTAATIEHLRRTKPWVRFMSVLAFIGSGVMALVGLLALLGSTFQGLPRGVGSWGIGLVYLLLAVLYIFPALYLWRYADAINSLGNPPDSLALEEAMKHQAAYWRFIGILSVAFILGFVVILGLLVVFGLATR